MGTISNFIFLVKNLRSSLYEYRRTHPSPKDFGRLDGTSHVDAPNSITYKKGIYIDEQVRIKTNLRIINTSNEKVFIKKYSSIAADCTIVTNSHRSTVTIPHCLLGPSHINDKSTDVTINEDVWVGTRVTILAGVNLGRGCIASAGAVITKSVPPYALVAGVPAKIIAVKFSLEDIERHEAALYPPKERMTHEELENLFATYYSDKKVFGCSTPLTTEQIAVLESMKAKRNLKEYPNFNMK